MALEDQNPFDLSGTMSMIQPSLTSSVPILMDPTDASAGSVQIASANPTREEMQAYVKQAAIARGIDPAIAEKVVSGEGGWSDPYQHGRSPAPKSQDPALGKLENSYGPLQLYISGTGAGLGDKALAAGVDPRKDWKKGVDFGLDHAKENGWDEWYGAKAAGITGKMGIGGTPGPANVSNMTTPTSAPAGVGPVPANLPSSADQASQPAGASPSDMAGAGADSSGRTQLMKMMLAASLANVRLQPVDYDPYKVMPHIQY